MKNIGDVKGMLERGYQLTIQRQIGTISRPGTYQARLTLQPNPYLITGCEEVAINSFIKVFPEIMEQLEQPHVTCKVTYDRSTCKVISQIIQSKEDSLDCDNPFFELVENLQESGDIVCESLLNLNTKIENKKSKSLVKKIQQK